jgi:hypothetical protein
MLFSRMASIFLRFGQFVSGAVVLGLMAHFVHQWDKYGIGPSGREIYTLVIAALSVLFSLIWLIPTTASMLHYPFDLVLSAAWFASFGALVNWIHKLHCGSAFHWGGLTRGDYCGRWRASEAFAFISACFWFASFLLGVYVYHRVTPVATDGTRTSRRRWGRSSRV